MKTGEFKLAESCARIISDAVSICYARRPDLDDTPFFESAAQGLKAVLANKDQKKLIEHEDLLRDLVTPLFCETSYAFDKKVEVENDVQGNRHKKLKEIWVPAGRKTAASLYTSLQGMIEADPKDKALQELSDDIETLASQLPQGLQEEMGITSPNLSEQPSKQDAPEFIS